jgi:hypothetical protein
MPWGEFIRGVYAPIKYSMYLPDDWLPLLQNFFWVALRPASAFKQIEFGFLSQQPVSSWSYTWTDSFSVLVHADSAWGNCPFIHVLTQKLLDEFSYDFVRHSAWAINLTLPNLRHKWIFSYTGQFKKKVTLSNVHNEVTSEPTITRYTTIVRKTLKVCLWLTRVSVSGCRRPGRPCCKMATPQQKAFCILQFAKTNSVTTVQRLFRTRFGIDPPARNTTPAKWSSGIETAHHRRCGNHKQGHTGESLDRIVR